jgi:hypothetical protein
MDLDHLKKLVDASLDEADDGPAYAELERYVTEHVTRTGDLRLVRTRAALREALEMVHVGYQPERLQVLQDFYDGKREGL